MNSEYELMVIGGGINGAGIARDAAGRGVRVALVEQADFGSGTSSASSRLIHGGLRYLERMEFRLVAESLREREVLLRVAPHLIRPLCFVLPHVPALRPAWMMRIGLWLYDRLGGRGSLPRSRRIDLRNAPESAPLQPHLRTGFIYWDAAVDDARLVIANLRSAAAHGATVLPRTRFLSARRTRSGWEVTLAGANGERLQCRTRTLVNAAGPWVEEVLAQLPVGERQARVQLVKGSHIVVPRLHEGEHAYILQNTDGRVVFVLPFEQRYSLIGTTDVVIERPEQGWRIRKEEVRYLLEAVNRYLATPVQEQDVVWTYSGVRPLYDDGSENPSAITRDYSLKLSVEDEAPLLSVFGGKITTYRRLAEAVLAKLQPWLKESRGAWTTNEPLPGSATFDRQESWAALQARYPALPQTLLASLFRRHGTEAAAVLGDALSESALGRHFGGSLYEREVRHFVAHEWASSAEDVLWRRSKAGLELSPAQREAFTVWFQDAFAATGAIEADNTMQTFP